MRNQNHQESSGIIINHPLFRPNVIKVLEFRIATLRTLRFLEWLDLWLRARPALLDGDAGGPPGRSWVNINGLYVP
jgi:hypothetical protein